MKKKNSLTILSTLLLCFFSIAAHDTLAQKALPAQETLKVKKSTSQQYIDISSVPMDQQSKMFGELSAEEKASCMRLHLSLQFLERVKLNDIQKAVIFDALALSKSEMYDFSDPQRRSKAKNSVEDLTARAKGVFSPKEVYEIFAQLGTSRENLEKLKKYENFTSYTVSSRKIFFRNASPAEKADMWKIHTALFLSEQTNLDARQTKFVMVIFDFLRTENFDIPTTNSNWEAKIHKPTASIMEEALLIFSRADAGKLLSDLGGAEGKIKLETDVPVPEDTRANCGCNRGSGDLCVYFCEGTDCNVVSGCGPFWLWTCNGQNCYVPWET